MEEFLSHNVKIVYDDANKVVIKFGLFLRVEKDFILIKNNEGNVEAVSIKSIIRMEVVTDK